MDQLSNIVNRLAPDDVVLLGIPYDHSSTYMRGPAKAPEKIRETLHCGAANLCVESGVDLGGESRWRDAGDLRLSSKKTLLNRSRRVCSGCLKKEPGCSPWGVITP